MGDLLKQWVRDGWLPSANSVNNGVTAVGLAAGLRQSFVPYEIMSVYLEAPTNKLPSVQAYVPKVNAQIRAQSSKRQID